MRSRTSYEKGLRQSREAKQRRTGTCQDCGAPTRYNGSTINGPSRLCVPCASKRTGLKLRGRGKLAEQLFALLEERGSMRFMEISEALGIDVGYTANLVWRLHHYGLLERPRRGVYTKAKS